MNNTLKNKKELEALYSQDSNLNCFDCGKNKNLHP